MKLVGSRRVFSVEEVSARLAAMFEGLRSFWLEAEVQDLRPGRGQMYFRLRGGTTLDATMNGVVYDRLAHKPRDGTLVQAYGRIEFWSARGAITMRVERLELAGEGLLRAQVEELRRRLERRGPARPRPPPAGPAPAPEGRPGDEPGRRRAGRLPHERARPLPAGRRAGGGRAGAGRGGAGGDRARARPTWTPARTSM